MRPKLQSGNRFASPSAWQSAVTSAIYLAVIGMLIYSAFLIIQTPFYLRNLEASVSQASGDLAEGLPELKSLDAYRDIMDQHPVFGAAKQEGVTASRSGCEDFASVNLLSGIIQGDVPEALFVSKRGRQTYFAKPGETLENIVVESVRDHSVIISCGNDKKELFIEET